VNHHSLLEQVVNIAIAAGDVILDVYDKEYEIAHKADGSPVTTADHRAHDVIVEQLQALTPDIPVLSEESKGIDVKDRLQWARLWLVDPLDGTKEFIRRNGEFSVNIGLAENGKPILGVVYSPCTRTSYFAALGKGAWRQIARKPARRIQVDSYDPSRPRMVASRSHSGAAISAFRDALTVASGTAPQIVSMGSALKACVVAQGDADVYPRLAPSSEWDTCASHCVLNEAGGRLIDCTGAALRYNKASVLNPWFLAIADSNVDWLGLCPPEPVQG
jgi:3'(2'), 5'-bisphosphate nucleotidase